MSDVQIRIDLDNGGQQFYTPGSTISGFVHVSSEKQIQARAVELAFIGKATTSWYEDESDGAENDSVTESSEIVYANSVSTLLKPPDQRL